MRLAFAFAVIFLAAVHSRAAEIGPSAAWEPLMGVTAEFRDACKTKPVPDVRSCLLDFMTRSSATVAAVDFAWSLDGEGWLRRFEERGKVDVAFAHYPFRANANEGVLLVNGTPAIVDVSSAAALKPLEEDARLGEVRTRQPDAAIWADDPGRPELEARPGGGQRFVFEFPVRVCHACADLASVRVGYDFDGDGRFLGTRLLTVGNPASFSVEGVVGRGELFEAPVDSTRTFRLKPFSEGWVIEVTDKAGHDDCSVVTPPYQGLNELSLFGWQFTDGPGKVREFRCVQTPEEFAAASESLKAVLWTKDKNWKKTEDAAQVHERVAAAAQRGTLTVARVELGNVGEGKRPWIESLRFRFELRAHGPAAR